jgi:hypothetical protein
MAMNNTLVDASINQSSTISDDTVNLIYNVFSAEMMKTYKNVLVNLNRNFKRRKTTNYAEWCIVKRVAELCEQYNFDLKCYIKYCFLNRLVPHGKGKGIKDIVFLTHYQQLSDYGNQQAEIERLYKIYINILKSIMRIKSFKNRTNKNTKDILKDIISSGQLFDYILTGVISKHFLVLIPNISNYVYRFSHNERTSDTHVVDNFCKTIGMYGKDAIAAMKMFYPSGLSKNIIQLCNEN